MTKKVQSMSKQQTSWVIVPVMAAMFGIFVFLGFRFGCDFMERDAVKNGAAYWAAGENGEPTFSWRTDESR